MTVTAQFAGVLNVPMYVLPYTIPNAAGTTGFGFSPNTGDSPIINQTPRTSIAYARNPWAPGNLAPSQGSNGITFSKVWVLTPLAYSAINISAANTTFTTSGVQQPAVLQGTLMYPNMHAKSEPNGTWLWDIAYSQVPAYKSANFGFVPCADNVGNLFTVGSSASGFVEDAEIIGNSGPNRLLVNLIDDANIQQPILVGGAYGSVSYFGTPSIYCKTQFDNLASTQSLNQLGALFIQSIWSIPDPANFTNWLWWISDGAISVSNYQCVYGLVGGNIGVATTPSPVAWQTDNAAINAILASDTGYLITPCATGFILCMNTSPRADYFVSRDGTRYWQLNLIAQSGAPIRVGFTDVQNSRWIDSSGIVWYAGLDRQTNTTLSPLWSGALSIPYDPVILPQVPPLSGPCWSTCLGRIGGTPGSLNPDGSSPGTPSDIAVEQ